MKLDLLLIYPLLKMGIGIRLECLKPGVIVGTGIYQWEDTNLVLTRIWN
jgi:hypothetical protein